MSTYNYYVPAWITHRSPLRERAAVPHPPIEGTPDDASTTGDTAPADPLYSVAEQRGAPATDPEDLSRGKAPSQPQAPIQNEDSSRTDAQPRGEAHGRRDAAQNRTPGASASGELGDPLVRRPVAEASRHERKCSVCRHPEREAIEEAFLHWQSPNQIAIDYELEEASIYRHAHATGLFDRRDNYLRFALGNFIERVSEIQVVTPDAVVRAIRAYTRISKTGEWIEPPRQITVTHVRAAEPPPGEPDIMQITTPKAIKALSARLQDVAKGRVRRA